MVKNQKQCGCHLSFSVFASSISTERFPSFFLFPDSFTKGCKKIILFGSITEDRNTNNSDIDIAVSGVSINDFFSAIATLPAKINQPIDIIDIDDVPDFIKSNIEEKGIVLYAS